MSLVLVVNAGSTSLKLSLVDERGEAEVIEALEDAPAEVEAVGHRIVHGGARFGGPTLVDDDVRRALDALTELAPLQNERALAALDEARRRLPDVPHVAVFDTAFHATIPPEASTYALPRRLREELGVRRFGFHGLSVQWAVSRVRVPRLVVCHLGGGCSVTAVRDGASVDTSMGLTPLEGVPMATRSGSVDPGALLHLLRTGKLTVDELERALEHESGLRGLSDGGSGDVREASPLALAVFCYRVACAVGSAAVPLDGLDALVFTGGIGEHAAAVRADVCGRLAFLGVELDPQANERAEPDATISAAGSAVAVHAIRSREDLVVAAAVRTVV